MPILEIKADATSFNNTEFNILTKRNTEHALTAWIEAMEGKKKQKNKLWKKIISSVKQFPQCNQEPIRGGNIQSVV